MIGDWLSSLADWATMLIADGGYWALLVLMFIDSVNVPIPSELVLGFTGYLVSTGQFSFWIAGAVATLGFTLGAAASYWIGLKGGRPFVERWGKYLLISRRDLERADKMFAKYGMAIAFFSRMIPLLRSFISIPAGITRVPFWSYLGYSFAGSLVWSLVLVYIGKVVGARYAVVAEKFEGVEYVVIALLGLAVLGWIAHFIWEQRLIRREAHEVTQGPDDKMQPKG